MESPTTRMTTTVTARIPRALGGDLEALAKSTGRTRNALLEEAVRRFIEVERWQLALIQDRVGQADAGAFADPAAVDRVYAKFRLPRRDPAKAAAE
ncbi:MAG TPA: ribbon-helix-helix protein, CopG family [Chloroflexota bacterium]|nr:ribbon-helix-helix protein, CopG family [Chloroflexota bacterium]